jgi:methionyl-tRNA formyltransferase
MNKMNKFKFAFFGTPEVASQTLEILVNNGYLPSIIITSPDARSGRGMSMNQSPVSIWALNHNIPCIKPEKINDEILNEIRKQEINLSIVVAYGKILSGALIKTPQLGTINIHYSLLPKYRGASPLESALLNGDEVTGVSIQQMTFKLDSGPIIAEREIPIDIEDTKEDLRTKLINLGSNLLCEILPDIIEEKISPKNQDESEATYCTKISKEDGQINLNADSKINYNKYRAFYGWPGTFFFTLKHKKQIRVKIKQATFENGLFVIQRVTPEGKKAISYEDFLKQN